MCFQTLWFVSIHTVRQTCWLRRMSIHGTSSHLSLIIKDSSLVQLQNMFLDFNKFNWKGSTLTWQKTDCHLTSEHGLRLNEKPHKVFQCAWSSCSSPVCHSWLSQAQTLTCCVSLRDTAALGKELWAVGISLNSQFIFMTTIIMQVLLTGS